jgi:hypothetical protein
MFEDDGEITMPMRDETITAGSSLELLQAVYRSTAPRPPNASGDRGVAV